MKKSILVLALLFSCVTNSFAASQGRTETVFSSQVVAGTNQTVVSRAYNIGSSSRFGYWVKPTAGASAGSTIRLNMVMQGAPNNTSSEFATITTIQNAMTTAAATLGTITAPNIQYVRFVTMGNTGNATDTTVTMYFFSQE